jgi:uncharacterized DUF497 family protein
MPVMFTWDERKATANLRKHGVSFDEAATVFDDPLAAIFPDEDHSHEEAREIIVGHSVLKRLMLVCFTERLEGTARIYSARRATKREQHAYEEHFES